MPRRPARGRGRGRGRGGRRPAAGGARRPKRAPKRKVLPDFPSFAGKPIQGARLLPLNWPHGVGDQKGDTYLAPCRSVVRGQCELDGSVGNLLGKGSWGQVYEVCKRNHCRYVLKLQLLRTQGMIESFFVETYFHSLIQQRGDELKLLLAPKLIDYWTCDTPQVDTIPPKMREATIQVGFMVMDRYDGSLLDLLDGLKKKSVFWFTSEYLVQAREQLLEAAQIYSQLHIKHGDIALRNILYRVHPFQVMLTDWGFAKFVEGAKVSQKLLDYYTIEIQKSLRDLEKLM